MKQFEYDPIFSRYPFSRISETESGCAKNQFVHQILPAFSAASLWFDVDEQIQKKLSHYEMG